MRKPRCHEPEAGRRRQRPSSGSYTNSLSAASRVRSRGRARCPPCFDLFRHAGRNGAERVIRTVVRAVSDHHPAVAVGRRQPGDEIDLLEPVRRAERRVHLITAADRLLACGAGGGRRGLIRRSKNLGERRGVDVLAPGDTTGRTLRSDVTLRPLRANRAISTRRTGRTGLTLRTSGTLRADCAIGTSRTLRPDRAVSTGRTLRPGLAVRTRRTLRADRAISARRTLRPDRAISTSRTRRPARPRRHGRAL